MAQPMDSSLVKPKGSKAVDAYTEADDVSGSKGEASESKNDDGSESKITIRNLIDSDPRLGFFRQHDFRK